MNEEMDVLMRDVTGETTAADAAELESSEADLGTDPSEAGSDPEDAQSDRPAKPGSGLRKKWGFKSFKIEEMNAAIQAAARNGMPVQDWVALAIRTRIQHEKEERAETRKTQPAVIPGEGVVDHTPPPEDPPIFILPPTLDEVERMIGMVKEMADITLAPPPLDVSRLVFRRLKERLSVGVPVRPRRPKVRPAAGEVRPHGVAPR